MGVLVSGLIVFLGAHSLRIFADPWRTQQLQRFGEGRWKGLVSLVSILGLALIAWGYGLARAHPVLLWAPPAALRDLAGLLTLFAFVMIVAAYVPGNGIKARLHHPMLLGVKTWAFAHLLANGTLADVLLFGAFLAWAVAAYAAAKKRDRAEGRQYPQGKPAATATTWVLGLGFWAAFAFWLHAWLIGVRPFG